MDLSALSPSEKQILIFSFYRDAELRGARLLFNMFSHLQDADSQLKLSKHLADETRHAWFWTRRIADLGGAPLMLASSSCWDLQSWLRSGLRADTWLMPRCPTSIRKPVKC
jgi:hypothetical protein